MLFRNVSLGRQAAILEPKARDPLYGPAHACMYVCTYVYLYVCRNFFSSLFMHTILFLPKPPVTMIQALLSDLTWEVFTYTNPGGHYSLDLERPTAPSVQKSSRIKE